MDYKKFFYDKSKDDFGPAPPTDCWDPVIKQQIDVLANDVIWVDSCKVILEHYDLHGISPVIEAIVDGVALENNDRVLILNAMWSVYNGIYVAEVYPYNRTMYARLSRSAADYSDTNSICTFIQEGREHAESIYISDYNTNEWFKIAGQLD